MAVASFMLFEDGDQMLFEDGSLMLFEDSGDVTDGPYRTDPASIHVPSSTAATVYVPGAERATIAL